MWDEQQVGLGFRGLTGLGGLGFKGLGFKAGFRGFRV